MEGIRILLVDDEPEFLAVLGARLTRRGYAVLTAGDGAEALAVLDREPNLDVVVLDLRMPGLSGIETLRRIKSARPLLEVIILTGHASVETGIEGIKNGAFDYLLKPCEVEALIEKIDQASHLKLKHEDQVVAVRSSPPKSRRRLMEDLDPAVRRALGEDGGGKKA